MSAEGEEEREEEEEGESRAIAAAVAMYLLPASFLLVSCVVLGDPAPAGRLNPPGPPPKFLLNELELRP